MMRTLYNRWTKKTPRERPKIPVMEQRVVTQADVEAADPPNKQLAIETLSLRRQLAERLIELSRHSESLRSELARQSLNSL